MISNSTKAAIKAKREAFADFACAIDDLRCRSEFDRANAVTQGVAEQLQPLDEVRGVLELPFIGSMLKAVFA